MLFNELKKKTEVNAVAVPVTEEVALPITENSVENEANPPMVRADETENNVDFGEVLGKLAAGSEEQTAIAGIMELTHSDSETQDANLAMKSHVTHAGAFTAGQWMANYNDALGMPQVAEALRMICKWQYTHNSALKGERAKQAFAALKEEVDKEFMLQKEAKGLLK